MKRHLFDAENASQEERRARLEPQGWLQEGLYRIRSLEASLANVRWVGTRNYLSSGIAVRGPNATSIGI